jgi:hypothetical protein
MLSGESDHSRRSHAMSDNLRQYRAIRKVLTQGYPGEPQGQRARHLTTLAALISGIVASKSTQLPHIAVKVPDSTKPESRVKRFARWVDNDTITAEVYFLPSAKRLLQRLAFQMLVARYRWECRGTRLRRADDACRL